LESPENYFIIFSISVKKQLKINSVDSRLILRANELQREAGRIVEELGLIKIIGKISKPKIVGSVANGLMFAKDIDIHAYVHKYDIQAIVNLLPKFALLPTIQKAQFSNYRDLRRDYIKDRSSFPRSYYVGLRSIQPSGEWKIDIWFAKKGEIGEFNDPRLKNLTNKQREIILQLKKMWSNKDGYRKGVLSVDFYKAILDFGVENEVDFKRYLKTKITQ